jgi:hypothetical protein
MDINDTIKDAMISVATDNHLIVLRRLGNYLEREDVYGLVLQAAAQK